VIEGVTPGAAIAAEPAPRAPEEKKVELPPATALE
jgi:hypothetical protein